MAIISRSLWFLRRIGFTLIFLKIDYGLAIFIGVLMILYTVIRWCGILCGRTWSIFFVPLGILPGELSAGGVGERRTRRLEPSE